MIKYRLRYEKGTAAQYVSHLDLLKMFARAARRCALPLAYSQGFNPHPELVFNAPLPLGATSEAEYVDMTLTEEIPETECLSKLASALPEGVRPISVRRLEPSEPTVMKDVCACAYRMEIQVAGIAPQTYLEKASAVLDTQKPVLVMKKSKSGTRETDIRPMIRSIFKNCSIAEDRITFETVTAAGNEVNLRPELAVEGVTREAFGETDAVRVLSVHKLRYFTHSGNGPD